MANPTYTDLELIEMEKELNQIYAQTQKELSDKWDKYAKKAQEKTKKAYDNLEQAKLTGTPDEIVQAKAAYDKAAYNATLLDDHYKALVDQTTNKIAEANQIATTYLNGEMPKVYCHSYNEFANENIKGYSFELVNEDAVKYLVESGNTNLLPQKKLSLPKDKMWNTKNINSGVLQGILQGESIPDISKRLFPEIMAATDLTGLTADEIAGIMKKNKDAAVRTARTMTTGAENKGRMDSFTRAKNDGVILKKIWVSAHDGVTRDWHLELHGQERDIDEPFEDSIGEIMYPGDPTAAPANVYNCRCAIRSKIKGFKPMPVKSEYGEKYKGTSVTAQYYSMLDENKALGNEFWKILKMEGKPSEVWKDYLAGNASPGVTKALNDTLSKYKDTGKPIKPGKAANAAKAAAQAPAPAIPKPDLGMYQDKSMTATFYSIQAEDKALGKEFWSVIQSADNPSAMWQQYLIGVAPDDITKKLDDILLKHKGTGAWTKPVSDKKLVIKDKFINADTLADIESIDYDAYLEFKHTFLNDPNFTGSVNEYWKQYKAGVIKNSELDKIFKEKGTATKATKTTKTTTKTTAKTTAKVDDATELEKAKAELSAAQGEIDAFGTKKYSGIWKDDVTLADYDAKKGAIQAKKDYYHNEIDKYDKMLDAGDISQAVHDQKCLAFEKYLADLDEFESQGKAYAAAVKKYEKAAQKVSSLTPVGEKFGPEAYTQARKDAALWAKTDKEYRDLDKYYDDLAEKVHASKTSIEHDGYYHYTWGSGPFNSPLAGFEYGFNTSGYGFKGPGKVDIDVGGYGDRIRGLTSLTERSKYDRDFWVQSGQNQATFEGFLDIPYGSVGSMTEAELQQFVGIEKEIPQFISGSINKGGGSYTPGDMIFNVYCPSGSEALYVRSDGHFGKHEHEMILQRGGTYKVTKVYWGKDTTTGSKKLIVDLELHPERGYNKFQQVKK